MTPADDQILDAISTLLGLTPGDVYDKIQDGEFDKLATAALKAFVRNYHTLERREDSPPVDDTTILRACLKEIEADLGKLSRSGRSDPKKIRELKQDAANLRARLEVNTSGE